MTEEGRHIAGEPIRPPRLEDGALPPESIAEAFALAALAVSSRLPHLSLSDDEDDDDPLAPREGCVEDAGPTCGVIPDALVGARGGSDGGADEVVVGRGDEGDRVVVIGQELGREEGCAEGTREGEQRKEEGDEIVEQAILVKDFAKGEDEASQNLLQRKEARYIRSPIARRDSLERFLEKML